MLIYTPAEDSFFMSETLKKKIKNKNIKILEIGAGSGIQLQTLKELGINNKNIFSCDINPEAVQHCKLIGFRCIRSDLFENIKGKYDLIIFNPPYLPEHKHDKQTDTTGGRRGNEIILKFLQQAKSHLEKNGKIFLITSSHTGKIDFKKYNYKFKKIANKKLFFEELFVWELRFNHNNPFKYIK